jgi:alpha-N-arabinofuranosidase
MNARIAVSLSVVLWLACALGAIGQSSAPATSGAINVTIDMHQTAPAVTKYEYGQFIEHIGSTMYSSLWAEMLDDRKFYFPVTSQETHPPAGQSDAASFGMVTRKWKPVGPDAVITMDKDHPFVGDQSPRITLDASTPHGIRQKGIALVDGKQYTGRIYLSGTPGAKVKVSLIWGTGEKDRESVTIASISGGYRRFPLSFTAKASTVDAVFEITGTGAGSIHIGAVSLMPADNIQGFRRDTTALLRQIPMGFWRYGGNYTSNLIWYHIVGDIDKRPPDWDYAWNAMQTNDLGLDEFMTLCKLINVEPYISVNAGLGDSHSAAQEVEYMNGAATTYMGAQRAKNGHPAPYAIKFWNIGNEPWGDWQIGHTDLKYYMIKHNEFAKAMRAVDPKITLIASAMMLQNDNVPGILRSKYVGNLDGLYGGDYDWTGGFLKSTWGNFDIIAEHWYAQGGHHWDIEKGKNLKYDEPADNAYVKTNMTMLESARYPADTVRLKVEEYEGYQKRFPQMVEKKIPLSIDEYAYFNMTPGSGDSPFGDMNLKQALAYAMILNEMMRHTDMITMAAQTTGVSLITNNKTASTLNSLGLLYKMYGEHFVGANPVALDGNSPQPAPKFPAGSPDQPKTPSGSPTYPLDMVAAVSADHKNLLISIVNASETEQTVGLSITGSHPAGAAKTLQLTGPTANAVNRVGQPTQIAVKETTIDQLPSSVTVSPISITLYEIPIVAE